MEALRAVDLLNDNDEVTDLGSTDALELQKRVNFYAENRLRHIGTEVDQCASSDEQFSALISSVSAANAVLSLMPSCFVYNRLYLNDPLIRYGSKPNEMAQTYNKSLGMDSSSDIKPDVISNKLMYFSKLAPLIRLGIIHILPIEELHALPEGQVPVFYSEDRFKSEVPEHIHDYVHSAAKISEVCPGSDGKGLIVLKIPPTAPTRGIHVAFQNDSQVVSCPFYLLHEQELIEKIGETQYRVAQKLDWDDPPSKELYDAWVYQSINRTIIQRIGSVSRELSLASRLKASYLTESEFEANICGMASDNSPKDSESVSAVNFLEANASYLNIESPEDIAKLRSNHGRLFERWQHSLLGIASELSGIEGDFSIKAKQLFEREVQPQIAELNEALTKAGGGIGGAVLLTSGTIGMALLSSATLPFAAVLGLGALAAGGRATPSVAEYLAKRKKPAFIWSKLSK